MRSSVDGEDPRFSETVELLAAARAGDKTALEKVVLRHQDQVLSRIRLMMGPEARRRAESMDFLQDAFANLVASLHRIHVENENSLVCFVLAVARNRIRDSVRKRREHAFESFSRSLDGQMAKTRTPSTRSRAANVSSTLPKRSRV
jgi:DNA-directed RNA polymerase specialized sigma24 family protein